eukprot:GILI01017711.1.p1 GENE.GILI01017711.1~~GILI01017711.1.p1  ORF type:complete len:433 (-),score=20.60 GILI01017711.1:40-1338(-)
MTATLVTTDKESYLLNGSILQHLQSFSSPLLLPPTILGDRLYYVESSTPNIVRQKSTSYTLDAPVIALAAHKNNVYVLSVNGLHVIDRYAEDYTTLPIDAPATKMASTGTSLLVGDEATIWVFDFETLSLTTIAAPFLPKDFTLSSFGTLMASGNTFIYRNGSLIPGNHDSTWNSERKEIQSPDGSLVSVQLDAISSLSPVADLDVPTECMVCMCELEDDPSVTLYCGHAFHTDCIRECLKRSEDYCNTGDHIAFQSAKCPGGCGRIVTHSVSTASASVISRKLQVEALTRRELRFEDGKSEDDLLFYVCSRCTKPFYGGLRHCPRMMGKEPPKDPKELVCEACATDFSCTYHGRDSVLYKCRFCCNPAAHRCFGSYYVCNRCDTRWTSAVPDIIVCNPATCPLGGDHPGHTYAIGCGLCDNPVDWSKVANE